MRSSLFAILVFFFASSALAGNGKRVLVYSGTGVCEGCPEDIARELNAQGYDVQLADEHEITLTKLKQFDLYIQPGGDDVATVKRALRGTTAQGLDGFQAIQSYVSDGGHFLGLCLGAFMADSSLEDDNTENLHLIAAVASPHAKTPKARLEYVDWQSIPTSLSGKTLAYFQDGPQFKLIEPERKQGTPTILAKYGTNESIAAVMNSYGRGRAMAVGIHPEATDDWLKEDHLKAAPEAVAKEQKIFLALVETLLRETTKKYLPATVNSPNIDSHPGQATAK